jgi:hypothetical protein
MKYLFFFLLVFSFSTFSFAQVKGGKNNKTAHTEKMVSISGRIESKSWAKSAQSYCAQGSGYFVLILSQKSGENQDEIILENKTKEKFEQFSGKKVKLTGYYYKKIVKASKNPHEQHPVGFDGEAVDVSCDKY